MYLTYKYVKIHELFNKLQKLFFVYTMRSNLDHLQWPIECAIQLVKSLEEGY